MRTSRRVTDAVSDATGQSPPVKQSTKVQEIAEQIHFDPNTMLPGAQHPALNYNATESSRRADEWRNFAQSQSGYGGLDDDDDLPPPVSGALDPHLLVLLTLL